MGGSGSIGVDLLALEHLTDRRLCRVWWWGGVGFIEKRSHLLEQQFKTLCNLRVAGASAANNGCR